MSDVPILLNNWEGSTVADVFTEFDGSRWSSYRDEDTPVAEKPEFAGAEILLASYGTPSYEGYAFVLFRREGKLYEVNGSHCSCYQLEGQWEPEETTVEALQHRIKEGRLGMGEWDCNPFAIELSKLLDRLAATGPPMSDTPITQAEIDALRTLYEAATPGDWLLSGACVIW